MNLCTTYACASSSKSAACICWQARAWRTAAARLGAASGSASCAAYYCPGACDSKQSTWLPPCLLHTYAAFNRSFLSSASRTNVRTHVRTHVRTQHNCTDLRSAPKPFFKYQSMLLSTSPHEKARHPVKTVKSETRSTQTGDTHDCT